MFEGILGGHYDHILQAQEVLFQDLKHHFVLSEPLLLLSIIYYRIEVNLLYVP